VLRKDIGSLIVPLAVLPMALLAVAVLPVTSASRGRSRLICCAIAECSPRNLPESTMSIAGNLLTNVECRGVSVITIQHISDVVLLYVKFIAFPFKTVIDAL
jgi:hypothetical protein